MTDSNDDDNEVLELLLREIAEHHGSAGDAVLRRAFALSSEIESGRRGRCRAAAASLARMRLGPTAVAACLVAPLIVEEPEQAQEITEELGSEAVSLVEGVARLLAIRWDRIEEEAAETLRKMFLAMARDVRVVLIVLALRVELMRALTRGDISSEPGRVAQETLDVFAPLANRLGIWHMKWELEDGALRQLEPKAFHALSRLLDERRDERDDFVRDVVSIIEGKLVEAGIEATVKGRAKHIYSIYKKMERKQVGFDQIFDVMAVRVTTDSVPNCYAVLGLVHSSWVPLPAEFDDYIAKPKDNNYQSLHTAVIGPGGRPVEVQIRTEEMHQFAEFGVAAHWAYKEQKKGADGNHDKFMLLRQLMDWERDVTDPHQFVESLKTDIFEDQVYVFTPQGHVIDLPLGATPLDFAYRVHTMVGHRCRGARVNDQIQSLDYKLKTGDRVEVLTQKQPSPSRDWMNSTFGFLHTSSARQSVRHWFRKQGRDTAITQGRELVDKELARLALAAATREEIATWLKFASVEEMYAAVGYGDRSQQSVTTAAIQIERERSPIEEVDLPPSQPPPAIKKKSASGLSLDGVDDILGKRARCCNPVPGDAVVGFISRGRGVMIHRRDCVHVTNSDEPERFVDIDWGPSQVERHVVDVEIRAHDRPGLLRDLTNLVANAGVNLTAARAEGHRDGSALLRLSLELRSAEQAAKILARMDKHPGVLEVRRRGRSKE